MISRITAGVLSAASMDRTGVFDLIVTVLLLALLVCREIITSTGMPAAVTWRRILDVAVLLLLLAFISILASRVIAASF